MGVDGVMIARVTPGGRLGMCMRGCSGTTVDMHVREYYRDIAGNVAPMCSYYVSVSVGITVVGVHMDSIWLGGDSGVALA